MRPNCELLGSGGTKRIAGDEQYALAFLVQSCGEFPDRRCLATAVHADDENDRRTGGEMQLAPGKCQETLDVFMKTRDGLIGRLPGFLFSDGPQTLDDLLRGRNAEVAHNEQVLKVVPERFGQGGLRAAEILDRRKTVARFS